MPHCIPIRDLKNTAEIARMCEQSHQPIYITKNGYEKMVIMSADAYEKMRLYSVYEKLMEAEEDIKAGRTCDASTVMTNLRSKYGL